MKAQETITAESPLVLPADRQLAFQERQFGTCAWWPTAAHPPVRSSAVEPIIGVGEDQLRPRSALVAKTICSFGACSYPTG